MPGGVAIWAKHSNIGENVRITALQGAEVLLAPHQTGGRDAPDPHTMGPVNRALWENREQDPAGIEAELRGSKGRGLADALAAGAGSRRGGPSCTGH